MNNPTLNREQSQVVEHISGNILVSASAGSGKTHTMTERILKLICDDGVSVLRLLAVTFTEASANDMREKIRLAISKKIEALVKVDEDKAKRLSEQLKELPTADVSTMHGFCGRLIRTYFFEAGVSPDFKILDKSQADAMRIDALNKTFTEFYDGNEDFLRVAKRHAYKRSDKKFKDLLLSVYAYADTESHSERFLDKYLELYSEAGVKAVAIEYKAGVDKRLKDFENRLTLALNSVENDGLKKAKDFVSSLLCAVKEGLTAKDIYEFVGKFSNFKLNVSYENGLDDGQKEIKAQAVGVRDEFYEVVKKVSKYIPQDYATDLKIATACKEHTGVIVKILERFTEIYSLDKREENALDFNDLEHFAIKILRNPELRESIKNGYDYVFVDEYQDTNGVQDEIISLLTENNLLMVGDVKQSIYGFRGCRAEFFSRKDEAMQANGEKVVRLNCNFRSADKVIETVNQIFDFCMTEKYYGESYSKNSRLISGGLYPENAVGRAEIHRIIGAPADGKKKEEEPRVYDLLKDCKESLPDDAIYTASLVKEIIDGELNEDYYDVKSGTFKKVEYKDIAILTRARESAFVTKLVNELSYRHGVPIVSLADESLLEYPEIQTMINALKAVDCIKWDLPLASTLKSPIGGFTDEELFEIAQFYLDEKGKHDDPFYKVYYYYIENADTPLSERLKEFNEYFNGVRFTADFLGAHGVMKKLVADKNLRAYLYAEKDGAEKVDRLNRFLFTALIGGGSLTVKEFLERIETSPDSFSLPRDGSENAVMAMTIHSSKGLEFPVVIICGLERKFVKDDEGEEILLSRRYGLAPKYYDDALKTGSTTPLRGLILSETDEQTLKEEMRLFYVATTRAKYSLHLVYTANEDKRKETFEGGNKYLDFIPLDMPITEHRQNLDGVVKDDGVTKTVIIGEPDMDAVKKMQERFSFSYPFRADVELPIKSSVTAVNAHEKDEAYAVVKLFDQEPLAKTNTELGTNAHKILELFDFDRRNDFDGEIDRLLKEGGITEDELKGLELGRIKSAIESDVFGLLKDKDLFREQSFILNVPAKLIFNTDTDTEVLVQGVIDLLAIKGNEAYIIDYKYSSLSVDKLKESYRKQLELYAYAVENCLKLTVKKKIIVSLLTGDAVEID